MPLVLGGFAYRAKALRLYVGVSVCLLKFYSVSAGICCCFRMVIADFATALQCAIYNTLRKRLRGPLSFARALRSCTYGFVCCSLV